MEQISGKDFFVADLHLGDERIIHYENRPFADAQEMDGKLIENWNHVVADEDRVFVLGDFSSHDARCDAEILDKLKGHKILIMGNHDRHRTPEQWRELGFEQCVEWPVVYRDFFILSHEPMYINANMPYANFYGHVHANPSYKDVSCQSVCVSVERIDYTPATFECLLAKCKEQKK